LPKPAADPRPAAAASKSPGAGCSRSTLQSRSVRMRTPTGLPAGFIPDSAMVAVAVGSRDQQDRAGSCC
jgi:hypothetical protein